MKTRKCILLALTLVMLKTPLFTMCCPAATTSRRSTTQAPQNWFDPVSTLMALRNPQGHQATHDSYQAITEGPRSIERLLLKLDTDGVSNSATPPHAPYTNRADIHNLLTHQPFTPKHQMLTRQAFMNGSDPTMVQLCRAITKNYRNLAHFLRKKSGDDTLSLFYSKA